MKKSTICLDCEAWTLKTAKYLEALQKIAKYDFSHTIVIEERQGQSLHKLEECEAVKIAKSVIASEPNP